MAKRKNPPAGGCAAVSLREASREHLRRSVKPPAALPVRTIPVDGEFPERGMCERLPWQYEVTAAIPTINAADRLPLVIALLRLQTVRPFIILIDTGSTPEQYRRIESLRAQDVEVQPLRLNGVQHSSEPVSMAMDVATALCRTRFLFCTHDDCFLRSRTALQHFRDVAAVAKIAGHAMTPRPHDDWRGMFSHSATMIDADWFKDSGLSWDMRRGMRLFGINDCSPLVERGNWPDTEVGLNYLVRLLRVESFITGTERNWKRTKDGLIDHCRSAASMAIHDRGQRMRETQAWLKAAVREGWERVAEWSLDDLPPADPLPAVPVKPRLKMPKFTPGNF